MTAFPNPTTKNLISRTNHKKKNFHFRYLRFHFNHFRRSICGAIGFVLFFQRLFLFSFDCALYFWNDALGPHAHSEALFQSALLALSPHVHVYFTIVAVFALVHRILCNAPSEETYRKDKRVSIKTARGFYVKWQQFWV